MATSIGIIPYSFTGYDYSISGMKKIDGLSDTINYTQSYKGTGGISQLYGGLSVRLFKHISLGANAIYLFGNNTYSRVLSISDISNSSLTSHVPHYILP